MLLHFTFFLIVFKTRHWKNNVTQLQSVDLEDGSKLNLSSNHIYIEKGVNISNNDVSKQLSVIDSIAKKANIDVVLSTRLAENENGRYEDGRIILNANKPAEFILSVFMHEVGHDIRANNPKSFKSISDFVLEFLKNKDVDVDTRIQKIQLLYAGKLDADNAREQALEELVCNTLMSIPGDETAVETIAQMDTDEKRSLLKALKDFFTKIKEYIHKYAYSRNMDEITALNEDVKAIRQIADMVKESLTGEKTEQRKNTQPDGSGVDSEVNYSIERTKDNKPVVIIDNDILYGKQKSEWIKIVKNNITKKFSGGIPISGRLIKVNRITKSEYTNSKYTKYLRDNKSDIYCDKLNSSNNLDEIILASTNYVNEDLKHTRKDNFVEFARGDVLIRVGSNDYKAKVIVGFTKSKQMVLYDIINFVPTQFDIKKESTPNDQQNEVIRSGILSNTNISQDNTDVNNNSMQKSKNDTDISRHSLDDQVYSNNFKNWFGDWQNGKVNKALLNDDGTPKVFYHATNKNFTVFNKGERGGLSGKGIYFSDYPMRFYGNNVMPVYLSVKNPMIMSVNEPEGAREINSSGIPTKIIDNFFEKFPQFDGIIGRDEVVVKNSTQIKSATDNIGAFDKNNPDIRYSLDGETDFRAKDIDPSKLDEKDLKVYNYRAWSYGLFNNEDMLLLNEKFKEFRNYNQRKDNMLADRTVIEDINNKIVLVGGTFENPQVYNVIVFNSDNETDIVGVKENVLYEIKRCANKYKFEEYMHNVEAYYGKEQVRGYSQEDFLYIKGRNKDFQRAQIPSNFKNYGYTRNNGQRNTDSEKAGRNISKLQVNKDIKYSLNDPGDITDESINHLFDDDEEAYDYSFEDDTVKLNKDVKDTISKTTSVISKMYDTTKDIKLSDEEMTKICKNILKEYGSTQNLELFKTDINICLEYLDSNTYSFEDTLIGVTSAMQRVLDKVTNKVDNFKFERENVRGILKSAGRIELDDSQVKEVADRFDGWNNYRKKLFGTANLARKSNNVNATTLETVWRTLSEEYPYLFNPDTISEEMPFELLQTLENLKINSTKHEC